MVEIQQENIPELRFPKFVEGWKEEQLGKISEFSKGKGISKSDIEDGAIIPCIRYGELYTTYGEVINQPVSYTNLEADNLVLSKQNDVIIPASGETAIDIATAACVVDEGIALSGDINIIRGEFDGIFLAYYLNSKLKNNIASLAQGNSVVHLYAQQLSTLNLFLPRREEQQKIADFLSEVDAKIEKLEDKKEGLEQYKKAMMQKIFSQEIRFTQADGSRFPDWEEKKLGEISQKLNNKNKNDENLPVLTNSAEYGVINQKDYFDREMTTKENLGSYSVVDVNDFIYNPRISQLAPVGPIKRNNLYKGLMSPLYTIFYIEKEYQDFLEKYFKTAVWYRYMKSVANYGARHDRMNISLSDFFNMPISLPSVNEQQKIAEFLSAIDEKIEAVNEKLNQAQQFKKSLLQKMFV